jgi:putative ABC transport system permease protein
MMIGLAARNLFRHRTRTAMTLAAIIFGVAGLILSGGFVQDVFLQLGEALIHSQTGHLQVMRAGYYEAGTRTPEKYLIEQPGALRSAIASTPSIDDVMARVAFSGLLNNGRSDWGIVGEGVEPDKEARLGSSLRIISGRQLRDADGAGTVIGQGVAQALKLSPGDSVTLLVNTADGALNSLELEVLGVFQSFSKDYDARAVRIPLRAAQEALATSGVNTLVIALRQTGDTTMTAGTLRQRFVSQSLDIRTWIELNDFYEKTLALYDRQFGVLQVIILVMVLLSVANSVNMSVYERVGEFGTMMALGNSRRYVTRLIIIEGALLGVIGSAAGVLIGAALALIISAIGIPMPPPPNANLAYIAHIRLAPTIIMSAFGVGVAATLFASLLPAFRVARTPVVDALRENV